MARDAGLMVPNHRLVRRLEDLERVSDFPLPYVAKPLLEGSSIGISQRNLIQDRNDGEILVRELLAQFEQPVMIEEFVSGREVNWNFIESSIDPMRAFVEVRWSANENYFETHIFDAAMKDISDVEQAIVPIDDLLAPEDRKALERLLQISGPLGYGRIDGKFVNGRFIFLELTPDAWLGAAGSFATSFAAQGYSYPALIERILFSAVETLPRQVASD